MPKKDTRSIIKRDQEIIKKDREIIERLRKANEELRRISQMKTDIIAVISHEFRTPLTIIKERISQVSDNIHGEINTRQREALSIATSEIDRLASMVKTVLDISKIDAGKTNVRKRFIDMRAIVMVVINEFKDYVKNKGILLCYHLPQEEVSLYADYEKIIQVLSNLLSNAFKFTNKDGRIAIEVKDNEKEIEVRVRDTGVGIAKENIPKLFTKFSQFGHTKTSDEKGTGLGLAISKGIIDAHKGRIWVESEIGKGSTFKFTLPKLSSEDMFKEYIENGIREAVNKETHLSIVVLKLENFDELKNIRALDTRKLLEELEDRIKKVLRRNTDIFLRDTGECVILLFGANSKGAVIVKHKIIEAAGKYLNEIQRLCDTTVKVAIGVSTFSDHIKTSDDLLLKARVRLESMYIGMDKRQHPRRVYMMNVKTTKGKGENFQTVDISEGGICIFTKHRINKGEENEFVLELPKGMGTVKVKAKVIWVKRDPDVNEYRAGFEFFGMSLKDRELIKKFVETGGN